MTLKITPLTPAIGAQVEGITLADPLSDEDQSAIRNALLNHYVIFFRNQPITPHQQRAFASRFGDLHVHPLYPNLGPDLPQIMVLKYDANNYPDQAGDHNWHTDVTFIQTPPLGSVLAAKQLPPLGGDTLWASGVAAFEALSKPLREWLLSQNLKAEHSFVKAFPAPRFHDQLEGVDAKKHWEEAVRNNPPVVHPVIRTHPETGQKALFVNKNFTTRILDLNPMESEYLLSFLYDHATQPEFTTRWKWEVNDVAFWDNRVTQHYAVADYMPATRIMHRATILGDKPT